VTGNTSPCALKNNAFIFYTSPTKAARQGRRFFILSCMILSLPSFFKRVDRAPFGRLECKTLVRSTASVSLLLTFKTRAGFCAAFSLTRYMSQFAPTFFDRRYVSLLHLEASATVFPLPTRIEPLRAKSSLVLSSRPSACLRNSNFSPPLTEKKPVSVLHNKPWSFAN